ncbi:hypothetical protein B0H13DRAFT_2242280 [Mycena leptocephala]|nr:hypothetical protein B0H13DRAFT_2242280 [Mycena leptocephala]
MSAKTIALAGNAFITTAPAGAGAVINSNGLANWNNANSICSAYFRMASAGEVTSHHHGTAFTVQLAGTTPKTYPVGTVNVAAPGYVQVDMQGVTKDGGYFGDVSGLSVTTTSALDYANDPANYYWSRRGPSVHMVTVPTGQDVVGSYFMVAGFSAGYSGIQVRENDRWVLFSVWDADDGQTTTLVSKGAGVAYLVFDWVAGNTYKFITRIRPMVQEHSLLGVVLRARIELLALLATWKRPSTNTYQSGGYTGRRVQYGNQWARNVNGTWSEAPPRKDYAGAWRTAASPPQRAFFPNYVPLNQNFNRPATGQQPTVDVNTLPTQ